MVIAMANVKSYRVIRVDSPPQPSPLAPEDDHYFLLEEVLSDEDGNEISVTVMRDHDYGSLSAAQRAAKQLTDLDPETWTGVVTFLIATNGSGIAEFCRTGHAGDDQPLDQTQIADILVQADGWFDEVDVDDVDERVARSTHPIDDLSTLVGLAPGEWVVHVPVRYPW